MKTKAKVVTFEELYKLLRGGSICERCITNACRAGVCPAWKRLKGGKR